MKTSWIVGREPVDLKDYLIEYGFNETMKHKVCWTSHRNITDVSLFISVFRCFQHYSIYFESSRRRPFPPSSIWSEWSRRRRLFYLLRMIEILTLCCLSVWSEWSKHQNLVLGVRLVRMIETSRFGAWLFFEWSKHRDLALGCSSNDRARFGAWLSCCSNDQEMGVCERDIEWAVGVCVFFEQSSNRLGHRLGHWRKDTRLISSDWQHYCLLEYSFLYIVVV